MARTVKEEEYTGKRNDILAAAQRLVFSKGYGRMTIQDVQAELNISSGAFYHYFDSKPALLEAVIERMMQEAEKPLLPIVADPTLTALEKFQRFFVTLERLRAANKDFLSSFARVWYSDDNAIVRLKVDEATIARRAPLFDKIVDQGMREGSFRISNLGRVGEAILALLSAMGTAHAKLLLSLDTAPNPAPVIEDILACYSAYMSAIERVLGAPDGSLHLQNPEPIEAWMAALRNNPKT